MKKDILSINIILIIILGIFSIGINFYYGNIGVFAVDTFAFFDTAYSILINKHPFKDIWITSGPLVDYLQAIFFKIFGINWFSYVLHASIFNLLITVICFFALNKLGLKSYYSFFYSISVAILCYPVAGTPFAYQHSYILSIISLFLFFISMKSESIILWFLLPIIMVFSFLSLHVPASYINFILLISIFIYFKYNYTLSKIISFLLGSIFILLFLISFFLFFEIPIINFVQQYILFPLSVGEYRVTGQEYSYFSLEERFTFRGVVGHFKFLHLFLILIFITLITNFFKKKSYKVEKVDLIIYFSLLSSTVLLIFHQLITSNQIFIFSMIPILAGFLHILWQKNLEKISFYHFIILFLVVIITFKYNNEYNIKRKFMDLQNVDLSKAVSANLLDSKLNGLKWISPFFSGTPEEEINLLKDTIKIVGEDSRNKMLITDHQFFSAILDQDLNIPNRWYTGDGSSYPLKGHRSKNHKYFNFYKNFLINKINNDKIEIIYSIQNPEKSMTVDYFLPYIDKYCVESKQYNSILWSYIIKEC